MYVLKTTQELTVFVNDIKQDNKTVGFVPTMGALHDGHLSLITYSLQATDVTISSIFVNPTQFNNPDDLKNYPRIIDKDIKILKKAGCHAVFIPSEDEMYPENDTRIFDFDGIDEIMEGKHRAGHFNGVAQIVSKLFDAVEPHKAFFGQKDFQQVAIIKIMTEKLNYKIDIIACPTIREDDGLAMSSRNKLLTKPHRDSAPIIYRTLKNATLKFSKEKDISKIKDWIALEISKSELLELEYFDVVNELTLNPVKSAHEDGDWIGCIAVWAGSVRLIDNIIFNS